MIFVLFLGCVIFLTILSVIFILYYETEFQKSSASLVNEFQRNSLQPNIFKQCGVATNCVESARVAINILKKGGSAADAAIAALLQEGVSNPHSMGVGGGFLLTYYDKKNKTIFTLNARECSPAAANENMYKNHHHISEGGLAAAVPGELKGYWELHSKFGKLPWQEVLQPTIDYCKNGIPVSCYAAGVMDLTSTKINSSPTLKQMLTNPSTGELYKVGELMKRQKLAETLELVSKEGPDALYNGQLTALFVQDIKDKGGIITEADLNNYRSKWANPIKTSLPNNLTLYSVPTPGAGSVLSLILEIIFGLPVDKDPVINWFRIIETWKFAFGFKSLYDSPCINSIPKEDVKYESTLLDELKDKVQNALRTSNDAKYYTSCYGNANYGGGTCHISILAPNGDAVAVTSSINTGYGCLFVSPSTGILLNNHMMDFNIPEYDPYKTLTNKIGPYRQPISNMCPTIILEDRTGNVRMVIGAAGGAKILTSISQVIIEHLLHKIPLCIAVQDRRLHHQLIPMDLKYEEGFSVKVLHVLQTMGHILKKMQQVYVSEHFIPASSSVAAISVENDEVYVNSDPRRNGASLGF